MHSYCVFGLPLICTRVRTRVHRVRFSVRRVFVHGYYTGSTTLACGPVGRRVVSVQAAAGLHAGTDSSSLLPLDDDLTAAIVI